VHFVAQHGLSSERADRMWRAYSMAPGRGSTAARAIMSRSVEQIPDVTADPEYRWAL
jgi:hypothetical protein